jgi:hypothetical protein
LVAGDRFEILDQLLVQRQRIGPGDCAPSLQIAFVSHRFSLLVV